MMLGGMLLRFSSPRIASPQSFLALICFRTAFQPTFGKIYKVFNVKWVFLIALSVFEGKSAVLLLLRPGV
jgi:hypothetical protein